MNFEKVQVECYSGYKANERPMAFTYQGRRFEIFEILDRWYDGSIDANQPRIDYFKVKTFEGQIFILRYVSLFDNWSLHILK